MELQVEIWVALITFGGTAVGSLGGILAASKLTNYRIECLEKKVDKHNSLIDRMYRVESRVESLEWQCQEKAQGRRPPAGGPWKIRS